MSRNRGRTLSQQTQRSSVIARENTDSADATCQDVLRNARKFIGLAPNVLQWLSGISYISPGLSQTRLRLFGEFTSANPERYDFRERAILELGWRLINSDSSFSGGSHMNMKYCKTDLDLRVLFPCSKTNFEPNMRY